MVTLISDYQIKGVENLGADTYMNTELLNRWIHENIMKKCWCTLIENNSKCSKCSIDIVYMCGGSPETVNNYRYTESLDAICVVEDVIIKAGESETYTEELLKVLGINSFNLVTSFIILKSTARERGEACKKTWEKIYDRSVEK